MNVHTNLDLTGVKEVRICFCIKIVIFCKKNTKTRDLDALEVTVFVK